MSGITENGDEGAQKTREERVYDAAMEYLDGADEHGVHPTLTFDGVAFGHKVTGSAVFRYKGSMQYLGSLLCFFIPLVIASFFNLQKSRQHSQGSRAQQRWSS